MFTKQSNFVLRTMVFTIAVGVLLMGCSSSNPDSEVEPEQPETAGLETTEFDGSWRADCTKKTLIGVPEDLQPEGYTQWTLTIDSSTNAYSLSRPDYTDSQCLVQVPNVTVNTTTGEIRFDRLITTVTGLEATVVRYFNNGTSPDYIGLLYRDGDVLYRDGGPGTVIEEDRVPDRLVLAVPWQLVN